VASAPARGPGRAWGPREGAAPRVHPEVAWQDPLCWSRLSYAKVRVSGTLQHCAKVSVLGTLQCSVTVSVQW